MDNNIAFDEKSISNIIKEYCDKRGFLNYTKVILDMVIKTETNCSGILIPKWHMKKAIKAEEIHKKKQISNLSTATNSNKKPPLNS